jgi:hypothetical protein
MRQLNATGFMHNRVRMITAMFLTKDLHVWWMHGESYFMQRLVDGEIASNNGGWQWSASTGTDAAPYFRVQNPWVQARRFDPEGEYIRRWIPELRDVPAAKFFAPPSPGIPLAKGYPLPMVDHAQERNAALEMFGAILVKARKVRRPHSGLARNDEAANRVLHPCRCLSGLRCCARLPPALAPARRRAESPRKRSIGPVRTACARKPLCFTKTSLLQPLPPRFVH